ncbi:ribonuclease E inhibitor RraB [Catenovulum sediminis]|uniref:Ribonuclease E inhibitor RraB n=1 Tax=Catenovulum sediminis TaxID=1740262 RepID=A0ABV1RFE8_9ALTE|nr:ribonuclease E inhibitor RraB [Catenovulum sediminis]
MFQFQTPDDQTSLILAEMAAEGIDLTQAMQIDFFAAFEFKEQAEKALPQVKTLSVNGVSFENIKIQKPEAGGGVELIASVTLVPEQPILDEWDQAFTDCVENLKGYSDGWGIAL